MFKVQVNTDSSIKGDERLQEIVEGIVNETLGRFRDDITRVEVHLADENGPKGGPDDKRCTMEARVRGLQPAAVTHRAAELRDAISGAARKLQASLDSTIGRRREVR